MNNEFPPGLIGELIKFILSASPRPVHEIAWVAAIGFVAGIAGRAYNVSGTGLNQYIIVVAPTGRGKEAIASGISKLLSAIMKSAPAANEFRGPTEIASPQALIKWLTRAPCVFSIIGEFGLKLKEMSAPHANPNVSGLKRALLDLYHKSGKENALGAMAYSKREDNTPVVQSPAFTLIGETTPDTLFENVNEGIVSNGLLSRFMVIEYCGPRVPLSKSHSDAIAPPCLVTKLAELITHCSSLSSRGEVHNIRADVAAETIFDKFNNFCDAQINADGVGTVATELWNRAHLKALKLAALYAVGENYHSPNISEANAIRARNEIFAQTGALIAKFSNGEYGAVEDNETLRRSMVLKATLHYCTTEFEKMPKYGLNEEMHRAKVISQSYLQRCLGNTAPFRRAHGGATKALASTLKNMTEADEIREIPKTQMTEKFGTYARAFSVSKPDAFVPETI